VDGTPRREQVDVKIALPHNTHGTLSVTSLLVADAEIAANGKRLLLDLGRTLRLAFDHVCTRRSRACRFARRAHALSLAVRANGARHAVAFPLAVGAGGARRAVAFQLPVRAGVARRAAVFSLAVRAGVAVRALAFLLPVRARVAVRTLSFQLPVRTGVTVHALVFQLPVRTGVALRALVFHLAVRAPLSSHHFHSVTRRAPRRVRCASREERSRGFAWASPGKNITFFFPFTTFRRLIARTRPINNQGISSANHRPFS
jgi:hypothetical protein